MKNDELLSKKNKRKYQELCAFTARELILETGIAIRVKEPEAS